MKIKRVLLCFAFLFLSNLAASNAQQLFIYRDFGHKGDENQIRGVVRAMFQSRPVEVREFNMGEEQQLTEALRKALQEPKPILLVVGEKTVPSFSKLLPVDQATTAHLCHMETKDHPQLIGKVDFIVLPTHAAREEFKALLKGSRTQLIETVGVAHNRQIEAVKKAYLERRDQLPSSALYQGVILGGDAPTPEGEILFFTEENARQLARSVAHFKGHFLITNGPRTGKYDPETKTEIKTAHRDGKLDFVTAAFVEELKKSGVLPNRFTVFDFQFGQPSNDMDVMLGAVRATNGFMFVPGESTSSISESVDVLPFQHAIVYENTAMNPVHKAHVVSEVKAGRIKLLDNNLQTGIPREKEGKKARSAAETIAAVLLESSN